MEPIAEKIARAKLWPPREFPQYSSARKLSPPLAQPSLRDAPRRTRGSVWKDRPQTASGRSPYQRYWRPARAMLLEIPRNSPDRAEPKRKTRLLQEAPRKARQSYRWSAGSK